MIKYLHLWMNMSTPPSPPPPTSVDNAPAILSAGSESTSSPSRKLESVDTATGSGWWTFNHPAQLNKAARSNEHDDSAFEEGSVEEDKDAATSAVPGWDTPWNPRPSPGMSLCTHLVILIFCISHLFFPLLLVGPFSISQSCMSL